MQTEIALPWRLDVSRGQVPEMLAKARTLFAQRTERTASMRFFLLECLAKHARVRRLTSGTYAQRSEAMEGVVDIRLVMSGLSLLMTGYFWLVRARKDRPNLQFFQLSHFRPSLRRDHADKAKKRLIVQQLETGGVLAVNHSTRQNSIVFFDCYLLTKTGAIQGEWGFGGDDKPPWNIGPESTIAFSPACVFEVDADFELPEQLRFEIDFVTASGKTFTHRFSQQAPERRSNTRRLVAANEVAPSAKAA